MDSAAEGFIEELKFPECYKAELSKIVDIMAASVKRDGPPIESGRINIEIPEEAILPYFFFEWLAETNIVIENLNLVISDLRILGKNFFMFQGLPRVRFYLLIRTFFYEFYRFREIFNQSVKSLQKLGYIPIEELDPIRNTFNEMFKQSMEIRDALVHRSPYWRGKEHWDLTFISALDECGMEEKYQNHGGPVVLQNALHQACEKTITVMLQQGSIMSRLIQRIINYWAEKTSQDKK